MIKENQFDVLIIDWRMPGMDGIETTHIIQHDIENTHVPTVIMISAYSRIDLRRSAKDIEFATLLSKPVTPSTLFNAILIAMGYDSSINTYVEISSDETNQAIYKLQGAHVLLVEDNEINMELANELLTSSGINVDTAYDGQEALILLEKNRYDGILMDCQMPVMDGYEATKRIRENATLKDLPIIAMTANAMATDKRRSLEAGMNDHISKPINIHQLFTTMAKYISPEDVDAIVPAKSTLPKNEETSEEPLNLPGIDITAGLKLMQNKWSFYKRLLLKFRDDKSNFEQEVRIAFDNEDLENVALLVHNLSGVSGNLGMVELNKACQELELACRQKTDEIEALLDKVIVELVKILSTLDTLA